MFQMLILLAIFCLFGGSNAILYDNLSGKPATKSQLRTYAAKKNTGFCTVNIEPCNPYEWKRVDGSCNNFEYPSTGTHNTPTLRLLPYDFSPTYEPRKSQYGCDLPSARRLRTEILQVGKAADLQITQLVSFYVLFMFGDIMSVHDVINYSRNITTCCKPGCRKDYRCTPIEIPVDDPVHRYSGISCMNLTRPQSFQTYGCREHGTEFARYVFQTPVFDLSQVYNMLPGFNEQIRTYENGMLKVEEENGLLFPPTDPESDYCILNQSPTETRCHKYHINGALGANLIIILFYLQHNQIAEELCALNPHWDDERLFYTARDINIAIAMQIYFYELLPVVLGKENMIADGVLCADGGFRDIYDENVLPKMSDEYVYVKRWFHTIQETTLKLYDREGYFLKTFPYVNGTTRTGYFTVDDNMLELVQCSFRQESGRFDYTIDYDMADRVLGGILLSSDVATSDLIKGRFFGFQPYIKYKEFCTKMPYNTFDDLEECFGSERLHRLKQVYKDPYDIELMAALWAELPIRGGRVPATMYCLMVEQLIRSVASDRHWYERPNRPYAFTEDQLQAIRRVTIAGVLCTVGDFVTEIQPNAFYTISSRNPLTKCCSPEIGKLDLTPWKEIYSCKGVV